MKEHSKQHSDKLAGRIVRSAGLEQPSDNFTSKVMDSILEDPVVLKYKSNPVFSKRAWAIAACLVVGISAWAFFGDFSEWGLIESTKQGISIHKYGDGQRFV